MVPGQLGDPLSPISSEKAQDHFLVLQQGVRLYFTGWLGRTMIRVKALTMVSDRYVVRTV